MTRAREITWGTAYYLSRKAAERYLRSYGMVATAGEARRAVDRKLAEGSIRIGKPNLELGQVLSDDGTRYFITQRTIRVSDRQHILDDYFEAEKADAQQGRREDDS